MIARMDGENYGKLVSYEIPTTLVAPSPAQAATLIESDPQISSTLSLIDQRGSVVQRGDVQLIPIGSSIIYARPIYVEGQGEGQFPRLRFVALAYGNSAVLVDFEGEGEFSTIDEGIAHLLAQPEVPTEPENPPPDGTTTTTPGSTTPTTVQPGPSTTVAGDVAGLLAQAQNEFNLAQQALQDNDLGSYQEHVNRARDLVNQASQLPGGGG
jgi:uncharacterized membrane protein (UPF0182 family)